MTKKNSIAAGAFALVAASSPLTAEAQASGIEGWDVPANSEFKMEGVPTRFLYPRDFTVPRDVFVDCDLLVKDGGNMLITIGFAGQFNAESKETKEQLSAQALKLIQNWKGSMDFGKNNVSGVLTHLNGQHMIPTSTIVKAAKKCKTEHPDHGRTIEQVINDYRR